MTHQPGVYVPLRALFLVISPNAGAILTSVEFLGVFSCRKLFVFEQQLLFRVDSLCDLGFSTLGWGKHHAPYPSLPSPTLPSPTLPSPPLPYPTLPNPTQPYPILPYPLSYPTPYPTLPYTLPYPYPTLYPLFVFEQQLLFRVYSLCDLGFSALRWGKHHALITSSSPS